MIAETIVVSAIKSGLHIRSLLPSAKVGEAPRLLLFSRSGFSDELATLARERSDVELVDLTRLYRGS